MTTIHSKTLPAPEAVAAVATHLHQRERRFLILWTVLLVAGSLFALIAPVIVASAIWLDSLHRRNGPANWTRLFAECVLIVVPLQFVLEYVTRGKMLENTAEAVSGYSRPILYNPVGRLMLWVLILEIFLWGPRMVMAGSKHLRERLVHAGADRDLAATLLAALKASEAGVTSGELFVAAKGREEGFSDALSYLMFFDWISIAKDGGRVWVLEDARRALGDG